MTDITMKKMLCWLTNTPESAHPFDNERFYDFVNSIIEHEQGYFDEAFFEESVRNTKRQHPGCITDVEEFCEEKIILIEHILNFMQYRQMLADGQH